jgi:hypothetical protein
MTSKAGIPKNIKESVWYNKYGTNSEGVCCSCILTQIRSVSFHCGHIFAEAKGGKTEENNLLPICFSCNMRMGQQYMPYFVRKQFGRDLFNEMSQSMRNYQDTIHKIVDYNERVLKNLRTVGNTFIVSENTPDAFVEPIEIVFEYLIEQGYINTNWTEETYKQYINEQRNNIDNKLNYRFKNIKIGENIWTEIYISYSNVMPEITFQFTKSESPEFPAYYWSGWIYFDKHTTYKKLKNHPVYIHRYRNHSIN